MERVIQEQPANKRFADAKQELYSLRSLDEADRAGKDAEDTPLGAARNQARRGWFRIKAAIAGPLRGAEDGSLPFEAEYAAVDIRLVEQNTRVIDEVARREVVGPVDDYVVVSQDIEGVGRGQARLVRPDLDLGIQGAQSLPRGVRLGTPTFSVECRTCR